jgi:tellurite resistance protein TerC
MPDILSFFNTLDISHASWVLFFGVVGLLVVLDLTVFHREPSQPSFRKSLGWTLFYVAIAILFGAFVWHTFGAERGMEYYAGYAMELSLSMDNIFVISLIFRAMAVPPQHQHRVLFWGIVGVLLLRGVMIGLGAALVVQFDFVLALFGVLLIYTGLKMLFFDSEKTDVEENKLLQWMQKHLFITKQFFGQAFFVRQPHPVHAGKMVLWATPLFVTLILVETADVVFAIDSVPAIFGVTTDPFVIYTSNVFAILGLRSLYFTLQAMVGRFHYLSQALSLVLMFVGGKMVYEYFFHYKLPIEISLAVILLLILGGMAVSLLHTKKFEGERRS